MSISLYGALLFLHMLGAAIWTGGCVVLVFIVMPRALHNKQSRTLTKFDLALQRIVTPAFVLQLATGFWMATTKVGALGEWFAGTPQARALQLKVLLVAVTLGLAFYARMMVLPGLRDETVQKAEWPLKWLAFLSVLVLLAGVILRLSTVGPGAVP